MSDTPSVMPADITLNVPVAKIGESVQLVIPGSDIIGWLTVGVARVLQDAHAGIKQEDFADRAELRAAVVAAMFKRLDGGPGGNRAPRGAKDEVGEEMAKILRAKLKAMKVDHKEFKTVQALVNAFHGAVAERHPDVPTERLIAATEKMRLDAAAIVEARRKASEAGPSLDDLLS